MNQNKFVAIVLIIIVAVATGLAIYFLTQRESFDTRENLTKELGEELDREKERIYSEPWMEKVDSQILILYLVYTEKETYFSGRNWTVDELLKSSSLDYKDGKIEVEIRGTNLKSKEWEIFGTFGTTVGATDSFASGEIRLDDLEKIAEIPEVYSIGRVNRPVPL